MAPDGEDHPFDTLPPRQRRRLVASILLRTIGVTALVVAAYFLLPLDHTFGLETVIGLILGVLALFCRHRMAGMEDHPL